MSLDSLCYILSHLHGKGQQLRPSKCASPFRWRELPLPPHLEMHPLYFPGVRPCNLDVQWLVVVDGHCGYVWFAEIVLPDLSATAVSVTE